MNVPKRRDRKPPAIGANLAGDSRGDPLQVQTELGHLALHVAQRLKLLQVEQLLPRVNDLPLHENQTAKQ